MSDGGLPDARRATRARHDTIYELLRSGIDGVEELAGHLGVSPSTVRRDLARLDAEGRVMRTLGGAVVTGPARFVERPFTDSAELHLDEKRAIAELALTLVPAGASVFVDGGTTCLELARLLVRTGPRRVVTRGLESAHLLAGAPGIELVMLGGTIRPQSRAAVGVTALAAAERMSVDLAFLGTDLLHPELGLGEPTADETAVKEAVARRAGHHYVLTDTSKISRQAAPSWMPMNPNLSVVTDARVPADLLAALRDRVEVLVVPTAH